MFTYSFVVNTTICAKKLCGRGEQYSNGLLQYYFADLHTVSHSVIRITSPGKENGIYSTPISACRVIYNGNLTGGAK